MTFDGMTHDEALTILEKLTAPELTEANTVLVMTLLREIRRLDATIARVREVGERFRSLSSDGKVLRGAWSVGDEVLAALDGQEDTR